MPEINVNLFILLCIRATFEVNAQAMMVIFDDLLYDLETAKSIAFFFLTSKSAKYLHEVIVVFLQAENGEIAVCDLSKDAISLFLDDLMFFLFETIADNVEY